MSKFINEGNNRIPVPDGKKDMNGNQISILRDGTVLQERYGVSYLTAGGMGIIYKAIDRNTDLPCIIKEIVFNSTEDVQMKSFLKEKEMLSRFYHPGIVNLLDYFQESKSLYLVLEFVEGVPLDAFIKENKPSIKEIIYWSLQLCNVLDYLHRMDPPVIYRDLKPENIIIDKKDRIKLIDFGIARTYKEDKEKDTDIIGSPGFASPEQYGKKQTDGCSDIYSFGVLIHYLLTGLDPRKKDKLFVFDKVSLHNGDVPSCLENLISKCLEVNPEKRIQRIEEVEKVLKKLSSDYPFETVKPPDEIIEEEGRKEKKKDYWSKTLKYICFDIALLAIIFLFVIPFTTTAPDYMRGSATEGCYRVNVCERNLQNIAVALDMYAVDNYNLYPPDLHYLDGTYLKNAPTCPYSKREYSYKTFPISKPTYMLTNEMIDGLSNRIVKDNEILRPLAGKEFSRDVLEIKLKAMGIDYRADKIIKLAEIPNTYRIWCTLPESHLPSGYVPAKGSYPQYSPSEGIIGGI